MGITDYRVHQYLLRIRILPGGYRRGHHLHFDQFTDFSRTHLRPALINVYGTALLYGYTSNTYVQVTTDN
jgi:hypothetical protein